MSSSLGVETLGATIPVFSSQSPLNIYAANVTITASSGRLDVTIFDTDQCDASTGGCVMNEMAAPGDEQVKVSLNHTFYLGSIAEPTPYIRSKSTTTSNFRGCIGVKYRSL